MKIKRLLALAGTAALVGVLWGTPVSAEEHLPSITLDPSSVPAEEGEVTLTVTGANWTEPSPFFIVACPGAGGDPTAPLSVSTAPEAIALCPDLMASALAVEWDDGSFTTEWTVAITQAEIDIGALVVMAGWLSTDTLADPEANATITVLTVGESMDDSGEMGDEESMDGSGEMGDGESMDDSGEMGDEESMDDSGEMGDEELPETGHESGLLAIVAASVLVAGLLVVGAGRRLRTAIR